jgi:hypothetical protein
VWLQRFDPHGSGKSSGVWNLRQRRSSMKIINEEAAICFEEEDFSIFPTTLMCIYIILPSRIDLSDYIYYSLFLVYIRFFYYYKLIASFNENICVMPIVPIFFS